MESETLTQVYVNVPQRKLEDFMEKMGELDLETGIVSDKIPEAERSESLRRQALSEKNPERLIPWKNVRNKWVEKGWLSK